MKRSLRKALATVASLEGLSGSLLNASGGNSVRSLLVTSGRDGEGKTTMAVGIAAALARQSRNPVLLVDVNFRHPALATWFGVASEPGFREFLTSQTGEEIFHATGESGLFMLAAGHRGSLPELLAALPLKLKALLERFAYIVLDGDSTLTSSDTALFARHVDGVVLVAECERTKRGVIVQAQARLGGHLLGVALNKRKLYIPGVFYGKR